MSIVAGTHFKDICRLKDIDVSLVEQIDKRFPRIRVFPDLVVQVYPLRGLRSEEFILRIAST